MFVPKPITEWGMRLPRVASTITIHSMGQEGPYAYVKEDRGTDVREATQNLCCNFHGPFLVLLLLWHSLLMSSPGSFSSEGTLNFYFSEGFMPTLLLFLLHTLSPALSLIPLILISTYMSQSPKLHLLLWTLSWALYPNIKLLATWSLKGFSNSMCLNRSRLSLPNFLQVVFFLSLWFGLVESPSTLHYSFYDIKLVIKSWDSSLKTQMHPSSPSS